MFITLEVTYSLWKCRYYNYDFPLRNNIKMYELQEYVLNDHFIYRHYSQSKYFILIK